MGLPLLYVERKKDIVLQHSRGNTPHCRNLDILLDVPSGGGVLRVDSKLGQNSIFSIILSGKLKLSV